MSNLVYENVLKRLREERGRLSITKVDMSRYLHMDQSNYGKAELGQYRRFSYYEIKSMSDLGLNVNYIYTGKNKSILKRNDIIPDNATVNIPIIPEVTPQKRIPTKV